ncbi:MAG: ABC transporter ATP-binding protein [Bacteroidia bacterium]|nr:ABC transporter ATP-binding protein [Bacteroidia bacterium]MDW8089131.1 ABC transporter ATP-binding protein [Bacteroidia bacterium]
MSQILLEAVGLRYGHRWLFRGLSLAMQGGETWLVTGPNGSGKSSFLALLGGYLAPTAGQVRCGWGFTARAWVSPHVQPPPSLPVSAIVRDWAQARRLSIPPSFYQQWQLPPEVPFGRLSSGMRQRLLLALALTLPAGLYLLDEPLTFLDASFRTLFWDLLRPKLASGNFLLIYATNEPAEVPIAAKVLHLPTYAA